MKIEPTGTGNPIENLYQPRSSKDELITAKEKTSGALNLLSNFVSAGETTDPGTLIDIKIGNPLKRIYEVLQEIKKHQSTTFSMRFTIPLIALPIVLFAAFQLGRGQSICKQTTVSKVGMIKNMVVDVPESSTSKPLIGSLLKWTPWAQSTSKYVAENRTILVDQKGEITTILLPEKISLESFSNSNVIVTGLYSSCTNVMTVVSDKNVSVF